MLSPVLGHPQANDQVDNLEQDETCDTRVDERVSDRLELQQKLRGIAFQKASIHADAESLDGKDACGNRSPNPGHAVDTKNVQGIIDTDGWLDERDEKIADNSGPNPMIKAEPTSTNPAAGVIATKPATAPVIIPNQSAFHYEAIRSSTN